MKKTLVCLMLFVMGVALCPTVAVFADEQPPDNDEIPEFCAISYDIGAVNLTEEPEPDPEPEPE